MSARNERGFTLISVLVAITILSFGLMALARTQSGLIRTTTVTNARTTALTLARNYVEQVRVRPGTLVSEPATQVDETGAANANGAYSRTLTIVNESATLVRATVSVVYPRGTQPIELVTLIAR